MPTPALTALITSGGGAKGAFSVGALLKLAELGVVRYDLISGTSTGALIAALATIGDFKTLETVYLSVTNDDVLNKQNIVANFLANKSYLYSTDPLTKMIDTHITKNVFDKIMASTTILCLTAISLQSGNTTVFCTKAIPPSKKYDVIVIKTHQQLKDALLASGSQAGFLPPVTIETSKGKEQFVDGGNREVIPSSVVVDLEPQQVFVLSNNPSKLFTGKPNYSNKGILDVTLRAISIFIQDVRENDIATLEEFSRRSHATIFRIEPDSDLDPAHPTGLNFSIDSMMIWMAKGMKKAESIYKSNIIL